VRDDRQGQEGERNGAPFMDWVLPANLERVRRELRGSDDGDRQMVTILSAVLTDGLATVEAACAEALAGGDHPDTGALRLRNVPLADCARYDRLRRAG
jgi:hypothetical protein